MKILKPIIILCLCLFLLCFFIQTSTIKEHNEEINRLRRRVLNLETVVNYNLNTSNNRKDSKSESKKHEAFKI